jgi:hypothetical protein
MYSALYSCLVLMLLEFSGQIFEEYSSIKCHENPFVGNRVVLYFLSFLGGGGLTETNLKSNVLRVMRQIL